MIPTRIFTVSQISSLELIHTNGTGYLRPTPALYITPEVGVEPKAPSAIIAAAKQAATGFNSNFIPPNFGVLPGSTAVDDIFVFSNINRGNMLASAPHLTKTPIIVECSVMSTPGGGLLPGAGITRGNQELSESGDN